VGAAVEEVVAFEVTVVPLYGGVVRPSSLRVHQATHVVCKQRTQRATHQQNEAEGSRCSVHAQNMPRYCLRVLAASRRARTRRREEAYHFWSVQAVHVLSFGRGHFTPAPTQGRVGKFVGDGVFGHVDGFGLFVCTTDADDCEGKLTARGFVELGAAEPVEGRAEGALSL